MQPSAPLVEELEYVPMGHGNSVALWEVIWSIRPNPEAMRAGSSVLPVKRVGSLT